MLLEQHHAGGKAGIRLASVIVPPLTLAHAGSERKRDDQEREAAGGHHADVGYACRMAAGRSMVSDL